MKREREKKMEHGAGVRRHDSLVTLAASLAEVGRYSQLFTGGGCHVQKIEIPREIFRREYNGGNFFIIYAHVQAPAVVHENIALIFFAVKTHVAS